jgi:hypothetical protein
MTGWPTSAPAFGANVGLSSSPQLRLLNFFRHVSGALPFRPVLGRVGFLTLT